MKSAGPVFLCVLSVIFVLCIGIGESKAQVDIESTLAHKRVLQYEPIEMELKIVNRSFPTLQVGREKADAALFLEIKDQSGRVMTSMHPWGYHPALVKRGQSAAWKLNLLDLFDMRAAGSYTLRGGLDFGDQRFVSAPEYIDVVTGSHAGSTMVSTGRDGSLRECILETLHRDREKRLYMKITSRSEGICYAVIDLGRIVSVHAPELDVDGANQIHVLHQSSPAQYTHTIISPNGEVMDQSTYSTETGAPELSSSGNRIISVEGVPESIEEPRSYPSP